MVELFGRLLWSKVSPDGIKLQDEAFGVLHDSKVSILGSGPRDWSGLDANLLELVLAHLVHDTQSCRSVKDIISAMGVCRSWQAAGAAVFLSTCWQGCAAIRHPSQLNTLCPVPLPHAGHIKAHLVRELHGRGAMGRQQRFIMCQDAGPGSSHPRKFLLAAKQQGHNSYAFYLSRDCQGQPIALLRGNGLRTAYVLTAVPNGSSNNSSGKGGNTSSSCSEATGSCGSRTGAASSCVTSSLAAGSVTRSSSPPSSAINGSSCHVLSEKACVHGSSFCHKQLEVQQQMQPQDKKQQQHHGLPQISSCAVSTAAALRSYSAVRADSDHAKYGPCRPAPADADAAGAGGQVLLLLQYHLRIRGIMLPRRMSVSYLVHPPVRQQHHMAHAASLGGTYATQRQSTRALADKVCSCSALTTQAAAAAAGTATPAPDASHSTDQDQHHDQRQCRMSHPVGDLCSRCSSSLRQQGAAAVPMQQHQPCPVVAQRLENKLPVWSELLRCWCLNFKGRVKLASVKNFQLVSQNGATTSPDSSAVSSSSSSSSRSSRGATTSASVAAASRSASCPCCTSLMLTPSPDADGIVVQFGKVGADSFVLDYDPCVITALQAFAIALTTFGTKLLL